MMTKAKQESANAKGMSLTISTMDLLQNHCSRAGYFRSNPARIAEKFRKRSVRGMKCSAHFSSSITFAESDSPNVLMYSLFSFRNHQQTEKCRYGVVF
jgi:hypothetical protein